MQRTRLWHAACAHASPLPPLVCRLPSPSHPITTRGQDRSFGAGAGSAAGGRCPSCALCGGQGSRPRDCNRTGPQLECGGLGQQLVGGAPAALCVGGRGAGRVAMPCFSPRRPRGAGAPEARRCALKVAVLGGARWSEVGPGVLPWPWCAGMVSSVVLCWHSNC